MSNASPKTQTFLDELNESYLAVHRSKEEAFWRDKMDLKTKKPGEFEEMEIALQRFVSDISILPKIRKELERKDLEARERTGLQGWLRFFEVNAMENPEARRLQDHIVGLEAKLGEVRQRMDLGYKDPATGAHVPAGSVRLSLLMRTSPDEKLRQAAHAGLQSIERHVLENGFIEIVKERNRLGRMMGYEDYYDYKVNKNEGFSKQKLFAVLSELEKKTRAAGAHAIDELETKHGPAARRGYNVPYLISGDLTAQMDPYFDFASSLGRWGRSFTALGIRYNNAQLTLDLLDRKGKYENGFMHGPIPAYQKNGDFLPAAINFTANAIPGQVGSGHRALETLFHEGGHAAHFSNIRMPAPCFSQEYAPTSVAFAETQSMFLDSFIEDADWMTRYAKDKTGKSIPKELIFKNIEGKHPYLAFQVRSMLTVCFAEKAIYEMPEAELTPDNILNVIRRIEKEMQFLEEGTRPVLSVPHLLAGESSAYYHGYVLAQMAVHQTRRFFLRRDGHLVDNPAIGRDLAEHYWQAGNSRTFFEFVEALTGEPFSAEAIVADVSRPLDEVLRLAEQAVALEKEIPRLERPVDLDARIRIVHGDEVIAENTQGESFEEVERRFAAWITAPAAL